MSSDVNGGIGEHIAASGTAKGGAKGIVYSAVYQDTGPGIIHLRDGGAGGTIRASIRLGGAGSFPAAYPRGIAFGTNIYVDLTGSTAGQCSVSYE